MFPWSSPGVPTIDLHEVMTKSHSRVKADDPDISPASDGEKQANVSRRYQVVLQQLDDGPKFTREWFRLKEEELELRSH